ncbi:Uncharacterised protein [Atlantibacter hermannii]|nr:Uncharacterised protein [Atlantibacter hermannii]
MPLLSFDEPQPKLNPPISCWREDMPENHEPQLVPPQLRWLATRNDIYLEVPRYGTEVMWGRNDLYCDSNVYCRYWNGDFFSGFTGHNWKLFFCYYRINISYFFYLISIVCI